MSCIIVDLMIFALKFLRFSYCFAIRGFLVASDLEKRSKANGKLLIYSQLTSTPSTDRNILRVGYFISQVESEGIGLIVSLFFIL